VKCFIESRTLEFPIILFYICTWHHWLTFNTRLDTKVNPLRKTTIWTLQMCKHPGPLLTMHFLPMKSYPETTSRAPSQNHMEQGFLGKLGMNPFLPLQRYSNLFGGHKRNCFSLCRFHLYLENT
jgi:hypothetical protein